MHVTVCICTRDRPQSLVATLHSIMASRHPDFNVVVVDQSTSDATARVVRSVQSAECGPRVRYIRTTSVGSARAHNIAIAHARGPIIAFTDDDCVVSPEWLGRLVEYFRRDPTVGQVCGAVRAGRHDASDGFIPDYPVARTRRTASAWLKWREHGIGANMAFRAETLRRVGPFDEMLGPGAPLRACLDGDMTYRVLAAGYAVLSVPDAYVVHHGLRQGTRGQIYMRNAGFGIGAAHMKHLRLGDVAVVPTLLHEWARCIAWRRLLMLRRPTGLARLGAFTMGMAASFRFRIDPRSRVYIDPRIAASKYDHLDCRS